MIFDLREDEAPTELECDVCIAGAGAAGIALASRLRGRRLQVVLLEAGGFAPEPETRALHEGAVTGLPYYPLDATRVCALGGSTNHWGGKCAPLRPIDFQRRDWVPWSGWPLEAGDLAPYYTDAQGILDLGGIDEYDPGFLEQRGRHHLLPLDVVHPQAFQISPPTRMGEKYRDALRAAENVQLWLHAPVVAIDLQRDGRAVERLRVRRPDGRDLRVRARAFVLALGGIEIPRLLLNSNDVAPNGVGNDQDLVGRFFTEHVSYDAGILVPADEAEWHAAYGPFEMDGVRREPRLGLTEDVLGERGLLDASIELRTLSFEGKETEGFRALLGIRDRLRGEEGADGLSESIGRLVRDLGGAGRGVYDALLGTRRFVLYARVEQAPNPESRITLGAERDALGMRRVRLDWRLGELDVRTARSVPEIVAREVGRLGLGRVQVAEWLQEEPVPWAEHAIGNHHHTGTTRMHPDPKKGVVDPACRVHGTANLYVAGCSVFPTNGHANPTLTLVALTLRLTEHLERSLA